VLTFKASWSPFCFPGSRLNNVKDLCCWGTSVIKVTGYGVDNRGSISVRYRDLSFRHQLHTESWAYLAPYSLFIHRGKAAGVWSWPLTSVQWQAGVWSWPTHLRPVPGRSVKLTTHLRPVAGRSVKLTTHLRPMAGRSVKLTTHLRPEPGRSVKLTTHLRLVLESMKHRSLLRHSFTFIIDWAFSLYSN